MTASLHRRRRFADVSMNRSMPRGFRFLDALVAISTLTIMAITLYVSEEARSRVVEALAYGWAPVTLWSGSAICALRYRPHLFLEYWRYWAVSAAALIVLLGILSVFHPGSGVVQHVSLGGRWGTELGGSQPVLDIGKLFAFLILVTAILFPTATGRSLVRCLMFFERLLKWVKCKVGFLRLNGSIQTLAPYPSFLRGNSPPIVRPGKTEVIPGNDETVTRTEQPMTNHRNLDNASIMDLFSREEMIQSSSAVTASRSKGISRSLPDISILPDTSTPELCEEDVQDTARIIENTLASHGVQVKVLQIRVGPRIARFGVSPGWHDRTGAFNEDQTEEQFDPGGRVRVQSILARQKDLALALKTPGIRMQPNIPGEALVGIEVPLSYPGRINLRQVIESQEFADVAAGPGLPIGIGQDIDGKWVALDLAELPHILIAGATGTGKSVCLSTLVASLMFARSPEQVRFLMVDPKGVELVPFRDSPHLMAPVVTDSSEVSSVLDSLVTVMQQRYALFRKVNARNIRSYNEQVKTPLPSLVLIVDELAELMLGGGRDAEAALVRLAQMGRASGIHLVLSTQRPTVDVVTGLLKANISTRIAFTVASQTDSRVILDSSGAEMLLGKGDMLLLDTGSPIPRRVQGALVEESELLRTVEFWSSSPAI